MLRYSLFIIFLLPSLVLATDLYRWTDENGRVHFSDRAPEHESEQVKVKAPPLIGQDEAVRQSNERWQRLNSAEQQQRDEVSQQQQQAEQRHAHCEQAARDLEKLDQAISYIDEHDEDYEASMQRFTADTKRINQWIAANCSY